MFGLLGFQGFRVSVLRAFGFEGLGVRVALGDFKGGGIWVVGACGALGCSRDIVAFAGLSWHSLPNSRELVGISGHQPANSLALVGEWPNSPELVGICDWPTKIRWACIFRLCVGTPLHSTTSPSGK